MIAIASSLVHLAKPWKSVYDHSPVVSSSVMGAHLVALLFSGGFAVGADRSTLRALAGGDEMRRRHLGELKSVHRPVLIGLVLSFLTGALLAAADLETFLVSPVFWLKLAVVAVLMINGAVLVRTGETLERSPTPGLWRRLSRSSWASLALWTSTVIIGVALTAAA